MGLGLQMYGWVGFGTYGFRLGFGMYGLGFRMGSVFRMHGIGVWGDGFGVQDLGFRVQGL